MSEYDAEYEAPIMVTPFTLRPRIRATASRDVENVTLIPWSA
ncbi:hypothetical protein [Methanopyrus sp.]